MDEPFETDSDDIFDAASEDDVWDSDVCPVCNGTGQDWDLTECDHCDGEGYIWWLP